MGGELMGGQALRNLMGRILGTEYSEVPFSSFLGKNLKKGLYLIETLQYMVNLLRTFFVYIQSTPIPD